MMRVRNKRGYLKVRNRFGPPLARFEQNYIPEPNSGCWLWTGAADRKGYGRIKAYGNPTPLRAHAFAYEQFKGPVPLECDVRHTCDTPCCVNPDHLLIGTRQDNVDDAVRRKRHAFGERSGRAKLNEGQAIAIRNDLRDMQEIADAYSVSLRLVQFIKTGQRWKHLGPLDLGEVRTSDLTP